MNKHHQFHLKYEHRIRYVLILTGFIFIFIGFFTDPSWFYAFGDSYVPDGNCCSCRIYGDIIKSLLIIIGSFLFLTLLFKEHIIKLYDMCINKPNVVLAALLLLIFITLGFIAYFVFHNFPYCVDEYNYLYQAKIFSQGKLFIDVPDKYHPFKEMYMILNGNKLFSKYPPGFSLILSVGVLLNTPGLINPLIATITLFILYYFVKSFLGPVYGLLSVILMSTTPYFLGYSASYFAQPAALLLTTLIFFLVRKYELTSKEMYLVLLGLSSGYSFLTRPLDSFCVIVPSFIYLIYILHKKKNLKKVSYFVFTFFIVFAIFLIYNYMLIGKISIATYPIVNNEFRIVDPDSSGFIQNIKSILMDYIDNGFVYIPQLLLRYGLIPSALIIPLFAIFGIFKFKSKWKWVLIINFIMLVLLYNFHYGIGWPQYGARYYYSGFGSLVILATVSFKHLIERIEIKSMIFYLLSLVLCTHFVFSYILFWEYSYRFNIKLAVIEDITKKCHDDSIIILSKKEDIQLNPGCKRKLSFDLGSEQRNMFMNTGQFIADANDRHMDLDKIIAYFPNHSICYYDYAILNDLRAFPKWKNF